VLSTAGVLIGMLVMDQTFQHYHDGHGIVALAGIVVNNNIMPDRPYQEFKPVHAAGSRRSIARQSVASALCLLTTHHHDGRAAPMMFGLSLDFCNGGYTIDSPNIAVVKQLGDGGGVPDWDCDGAHAGADALAAPGARLATTYAEWNRPACWAACPWAVPAARRGIGLAAAGAAAQGPPNPPAGVALEPRKTLNPGPSYTAE